jgi:hypothetical protein
LFFSQKTLPGEKNLNAHSIQNGSFSAFFIYAAILNFRHFSYYEMKLRLIVNKL